MKVLFNTDTLNFRGTSVAIYDYAKYNQEILGNESIIAYQADFPYWHDGYNSEQVISTFKKSFELRPIYNGDLNSAYHNIDLAYFLRAGNPDPIPEHVKTAIHVVFQVYHPHGDRYAFISKWLSDHLTQGTVPYVPHIVTLPDPTENTKDKFGLNDKIIIGRYGGRTTFDLELAKQAVIDVLNLSNDFIFVFLNTDPFYYHPNIIYLDPINDLQEKSNYINMCDGFIHARNYGESFGLAICESLFFNKPVLAYNGGLDKNHIELLKNTNLLYNNKEELVEKILNIKTFNQNYRPIVDEFNPTNVMKRFKEVFLD